MKITQWLANKINKYFEEVKPKKPSYLCSFDRICHEIRPADVLLVEGHNWISRVIQRLTLSPWSHAFLYIGRLHDVTDPEIRELIHHFYKGSPSDQLIIESIVGKGTIVNNITAYKNHHIRICRPNGLLHTDAQKVIAYAAKTLGRQYHIRHILDLGRFLLKSRLIPRRWGSVLFEENNDVGPATRDICSAMLADAFASVKFPVLPLIREDEELHRLELIHRNSRLFTPRDFDYSPYFNIIKYPILSTTMPSYRHLPWNDEFISHDETIIKRNDPNDSD